MHYHRHWLRFARNFTRGAPTVIKRTAAGRRAPERASRAA